MSWLKIELFEKKSPFLAPKIKKEEKPNQFVSGLFDNLVRINYWLPQQQIRGYQLMHFHVEAEDYGQLNTYWCQLANVLRVSPTPSVFEYFPYTESSNILVTANCPFPELRSLFM